MRRIVFLMSALPLSVLVLSVTGCSNKGSPSHCAGSAGDEGCACASGDRCFTGLVCQSGTCVNPSGTGMDGGGTHTYSDAGPLTDSGNHQTHFDAGPSDAGTAYCGPDGGDAGPPTTPGDCTGGPVPGCTCTNVGESQTCQNGRSITCNANGEFGGIWGPCLGSCFSSGTWNLANTSPCITTDNNYATSSWFDGSGNVTCGGSYTGSSPPMPTMNWSTDSLQVDCTGNFMLCYTIKAGDASAPSASDCVVGQACTSGYYTTANTMQDLPPLGPWSSTDPSLRADVRDHGWVRRDVGRRYHGRLRAHRRRRGRRVRLQPRPLLPVVLRRRLLRQHLRLRSLHDGRLRQLLIAAIRLVRRPLIPSGVPDPRGPLSVGGTGPARSLAARVGHSETPQGEEMANVVLINSFEVPAGREEEFRSHWAAAAKVLEQAEGFVSTRLHESLDPSARFRFVNVAEWSTAQHFRAAIQSDAFRSVSEEMSFAANPSLYHVVEAIPSD